MAEGIKKPAIGPTKSSNDAGAALDAQVPDPDFICEPSTEKVYITLSTTLYPVDYAENLEVGCGPLSGWVAPIPSDEVANTHTVLGMTYVQARWYLEDGPYLDEVENTHTVLGMTYVQTRWYLEDGPYDDEMENTHTVLDMTYTKRKVKADTPDEMLEITGTIRATCTMDAV